MLGADPLDQKAREHLAARRFRKARDDFKVLCKKDRATYLPLLIEANTGLAEEMLSKGLISEAQQVVAYLKTVASAELLAAIDLKLAAKSGKMDQIPSAAIALLAGASSKLSSEDKIRWADQLVVTFAPTPAATAAEAHISSEASSIHAALEAVAAGQFERASDLVRPLPRLSLFSHWKVFVKALVAFHGGETGKASALFEALPTYSAPGLAREPYLLLLGRIEIGRQSWHESAIEVTGRLHGQSNWGPVLGRAQALWLNKHYLDSYRALRNGIPDFPSEGLSLLGVMSDFFFNTPFTLNEDDRSSYADFFESIEKSNNPKNKLELKRIHRLLCLMEVRDFEDEDEDEEDESLKLRWAAFLTEHQRVHGKNPRLESLGYGWLGETLGKPESASFFGYFESGLRDAQGSIVALEKSIDLDPDNLAAHLKLCVVYEFEKKTSQRNRLLDVMTTRFPESRDVLVLAGRGCLGRKAYSKGIAYLRKALQLDRIDPAIPELLVNSSLKLAHQFYQKGRADEGREVLERAEEFLCAQPESFWRNPWCHLARHGLLELEFADADKGNYLLDHARAASPSPLTFSWFVQMAGRFAGCQTHTVSKLRDDLHTFPKKGASVGQASVLVRIYAFCKSSTDPDDFEEEERWLVSYLKYAISQPFATGEAIELIESLLPHAALSRPAVALVKLMLKKDRNNPLLLCFNHLLKPQRDRYNEADEDHLEAVLDEATQRGDQKAMNLARKILGAQKSLPHFPFPPPSSSDGYPFDTMDELEAWSSDPSSKDMPPDFDFSSALLDKLKQLSEKEILILRDSCPSDIPPHFFEELLSLVRGAPSLPPAPPPLPKRPAQAPRAELSDPRQMDLF